jgi:hypothetical protein
MGAKPLKEKQARLGISWATAGTRSPRSLSNMNLMPKYSMTHNYYVGLDIHKETISIAYAHGGTREEATYHGQSFGSIAAVTKALEKLAEKLNVEFIQLKVCFKAGPTGFVIARYLGRMPKVTAETRSSKERRYSIDCLRPTSCRPRTRRRTGCPPETAFRMNALLPLH